MKYIFFSLLCLLICKHIYPCQYEDSLQTKSDEISSYNSLKCDSIDLQDCPIDDSVQQHQATFLEIDAEITSFNRKISQFKHYKNASSHQIRKYFMPEFKALCDKVRRFQEQELQISHADTQEPLDSELVQALAAVAIIQDLDKDNIPSPISCSLSRCAKPAVTALVQEDSSSSDASLCLVPTIAAPSLQYSSLSQGESKETGWPIMQKSHSHTLPGILGIMECMQCKGVDDSNLQDCQDFADQ
ncbi:MAG TPA: hypothetical protein VLG50_02300 [Candidatus Saccharimonadales bacterium]|nr:hypothetical protein [Candidatus Saccharimonadales bacterium]